MGRSKDYLLIQPRRTGRSLKSGQELYSYAERRGSDKSRDCKCCTCQRGKGNVQQETNCNGPKKPPNSAVGMDDSDRSVCSVLQNLGDIESGVAFEISNAYWNGDGSVKRISSPRRNRSCNNETCKYRQQVNSDRRPHSADAVMNKNGNCRGGSYGNRSNSSSISSVNERGQRNSSPARQINNNISRLDACEISSEEWAAVCNDIKRRAKKLQKNGGSKCCLKRNRSPSKPKVKQDKRDYELVSYKDRLKDNKGTKPANNNNKKPSDFNLDAIDDFLYTNNPRPQTCCCACQCSGNFSNEQGQAKDCAKPNDKMARPPNRDCANQDESRCYGLIEDQEDEPEECPCKYSNDNDEGWNDNQQECRDSGNFKDLQRSASGKSCNKYNDKPQGWSDKRKPYQPVGANKRTSSKSSFSNDQSSTLIMSKAKNAGYDGVGSSNEIDRLYQNLKELLKLGMKDIITTGLSEFNKYDSGKCCCRCLSKDPRNSEDMRYESGGVEYNVENTDNVRLKSGDKNSEGNAAQPVTETNLKEQENSTVIKVETLNTQENKDNTIASESKVIKNSTENLIDRCSSGCDLPCAPDLAEFCCLKQQLLAATTEIAQLHAQVGCLLLEKQVNDEEKNACSKKDKKKKSFGFFKKGSKKKCGKSENGTTDDEHEDFVNCVKDCMEEECNKDGKKDSGCSSKKDSNKDRNGGCNKDNNRGCNKDRKGGRSCSSSSDDSSCSSNERTNASSKRGCKNKSTGKGQGCADQKANSPPKNNYPYFTCCDCCPPPCSMNPCQYTPCCLNGLNDCQCTEMSCCPPPCCSPCCCSSKSATPCTSTETLVPCPSKCSSTQSNDCERTDVYNQTKREFKQILQCIKNDENLSKNCKRQSRKKAEQCQKQYRRSRSSSSSSCSSQCLTDSYDSSGSSSACCSSGSSCISSNARLKVKKGQTCCCVQEYMPYDCQYLMKPKRLRRRPRRNKNQNRCCQNAAPNMPPPAMYDPCCPMNCPGVPPMKVCPPPFMFCTMPCCFQNCDCNCVPPLRSIEPPSSWCDEPPMSPCCDINNQSLLTYYVSQYRLKSAEYFGKQKCCPKTMADLCGCGNPSQKKRGDIFRSPSKCSQASKSECAAESYDQWGRQANNKEGDCDEEKKKCSKRVCFCDN